MDARVALGVSCIMVASALAGCASPAATPAQDQPVDPNTLPAEGAAAPVANATGGAANATVPTPVVRLIVTPLSYRGATPGGACAFAAVAGNCAFPSAGSEYFHDLAVPGAPQKLVANVTWTAATPATQQLGAQLFVKTDGGYNSNETMPFLVGASPLLLDWDLKPFVGQELALGVFAGMGQGADPVFVFVGLPQDFAVEGAVTSQA